MKRLWTPWTSVLEGGAHSPDWRWGWADTTSRDEPVYVWSLSIVWDDLDAREVPAGAAVAEMELALFARNRGVLSAEVRHT